MNTVLIVDDEPQELRSLKIGLLNKGYNVIVTSGAQEALQRIEETDDPSQAAIDIVVTDFSMPDMNGMDLLKKIREKTRSLPIIMMTAYGEKNLVVEALRNQCDSYIEKPFSLDDLILEIERAMHHMVRNTNSHDLKKLLPRLMHQINNPLMAITGNAELGMLGLQDNGTLKKYLQEIMDAADKIKSLNSRIIKLGASNNRNNFEVINIIEVINGALKLFESLIVTKKIVLEKELGKVDVYVNGSRDDLEQAFNNLILNAIDAMDGKPLKILKLSARADNNENRTVLISVADTGLGIPEDQINRIFNPYYTRKNGGNGIGLAVVSEVISQHKGKITVKSEADSGTCFTVELPGIDIL
ncbi:MAG: response regulator [Pseudomonadota bacterium]